MYWAAVKYEHTLNCYEDNIPMKVKQNIFFDEHNSIKIICIILNYNHEKYTNIHLLMIAGNFILCIYMFAQWSCCSTNPKKIIIHFKYRKRLHEELKSVF